MFEYILYAGIMILAVLVFWLAAKCEKDDDD